MQGFFRKEQQQWDGKFLYPRIQFKSILEIVRYSMSLCEYQPWAVDTEFILFYICIYISIYILRNMRKFVVPVSFFLAIYIFKNYIVCTCDFYWFTLEGRHQSEFERWKGNNKKYCMSHQHQPCDKSDPWRQHRKLHGVRLLLGVLPDQVLASCDSRVIFKKDFGSEHRETLWWELVGLSRIIVRIIIALVSGPPTVTHTSFVSLPAITIAPLYNDRLH